jgi:hypothetical protein
VNPSSLRGCETLRANRSGPFAALNCDGGVKEPEKKTQASRYFLGSRPLTGIANVLYSWCLWHWLLTAFSVPLFGEGLSVTLTAALVSLVLAILTLHLIEIPIRFQTALPKTKASRIAIASAAPVGPAASSLHFGARISWWNSNPTSLDEQVSAVQLWKSTECDPPAPRGKRSAECIWNADAPGNPIYLVGDSMAGMLGEKALGAGEIPGRPAIPGTLGACPIIDLSLILCGREDHKCTTLFQERSNRLVSEAETGDVILASSFGYTTMDGAQLAAHELPGPTSTTSDETTADLNALGSTFSQLSDARH